MVPAAAMSAHVLQLLPESGSNGNMCALTAAAGAIFTAEAGAQSL